MDAITSISNLKALKSSQQDLSHLVPLQSNWVSTYLKARENKVLRQEKMKRNDEKQNKSDQQLQTAGAAPKLCAATIHL